MAGSAAAPAARCRNVRRGRVMMRPSRAVLQPQITRTSGGPESPGLNRGVFAPSPRPPPPAHRRRPLMQAPVAKLAADDILAISADVASLEPWRIDTRAQIAAPLVTLHTAPSCAVPRRSPQPTRRFADRGSWNVRPGGLAYSGLIPANLTTPPPFSISFSP